MSRRTQRGMSSVGEPASLSAWMQLCFSSVMSSMQTRRGSQAQNEVSLSFAVYRLCRRSSRRRRRSKAPSWVSRRECFRKHPAQGPRRAGIARALF